MKHIAVEEKKPIIIRFEDVEEGDMFLISEENNKEYYPFIKIHSKEEKPNAVSMDDGTLVTFDEYEKVLPVDISIRLKLQYE